MVQDEPFSTKVQKVKLVLTIVNLYEGTTYERENLSCNKTKLRMSPYMPGSSPIFLSLNVCRL